MANEQAVDEEVRAISDAELVKIRAVLLESADGTALQRQFRWALGCLLARYDADAKRIAELERVTGPVMHCGCYAVECVRDGASLFCRRYGLDHTAANPMEITPEYTAWKESR